jgi:hypothetical protein
MTTATLLKPDLWAPLRHLLQWLLPSSHVGPTTQTNNLPANRQYAPVLVAARAIPVRANTCFERKSKPLRIVRVVETGQPRTSVGRMVISGRMADVCAELDRLAACEAA